MTIVRLRNITIKVELMAGTDISQAAQELVILANRLGVWIEAKFNDVTLLACVDDSPDGLVADYHREVDGDHTHKIARDRGKH